MALNTQISDMPWLQQPNPGEFGLKAMQVGQEGARNFMAAYNSAKEHKREDALLPMRRALLNNQVENMALDIKKKMSDQADYLTKKKALIEVADDLEFAARNDRGAGWGADRPHAEPD